MATHARKRSSDEDGFIIIEVLVSALILAIVAGAVLTLITATTRGAATQRDRAVADDLAQADQARLRTLRIAQISGVKKEEEEVEKNGTTYHVVSERVYVNNKAGAVSCTEGTDKPDYVQLTSTVSSNTMLNPVVLQSVVSPSSGSLEPNVGSFSVETVNAVGEPVSGVSVTLSNGRTASTGIQGCATFAGLPKGTYTATYNGGLLVNTKGLSVSPETGISIEAATVKHVESSWDHPATLSPKFVYLEPGTGTPQPASVDSMSVINATNGFSEPVGTPGGARTSTLTKAVFPFKGPSEYTVYTGSCASNNPGTAGGNAVGLYSGVVTPSKTYEPQIHVPALELTVTNNSGVIATGAKVIVTDTNSSCKTKRTFTANGGGHLSSKEGGLTEPGLPYGIYSVCASLKVGKETQAATKEVKVQNFAAAGTTLALKLEKGKSECT
jgi:type II secretory pathway pseudopilin PulG